MECVNHPIITASGQCAQCGKPFCQLCLVSHDGAQVCERCKALLHKGVAAATPPPPSHLPESAIAAPDSAISATQSTPRPPVAAVPAPFPPVATPPVPMPPPISKPGVPRPRPRQACKEADIALTLGIIGLVCCFGILLGPMAIYYGVKAKSLIRQNPELTGEGKAQAAIVLGAIALIMTIFIILAQIVAA